MTNKLMKYSIIVYFSERLPKSEAKKSPVMSSLLAQSVDKTCMYLCGMYHCVNSHTRHVFVWYVPLCELSHKACICVVCTTV